jgi:hypothetical protein
MLLSYGLLFYLAWRDGLRSGFMYGTITEIALSFKACLADQVNYPNELGHKPAGGGRRLSLRAACQVFNFAELDAHNWSNRARSADRTS